MDKIVELIIKEIKDYNETLEIAINIAKGRDSVLFGQGSSLESVDFVSLIVNIEQAVSDEFGKEVSLVDARAMSQQKSPFRTVESLAEYIKNLLEED